MKCKRLMRYDENMIPVFTNKRKFDTLDLAIIEAKKINSADHTIHKVVAYKCTECYNYHIGRNGKILKEKQRNKYKNEKAN